MSPLQAAGNQSTANKTLMDTLTAQNNRLESLTQLERLFAFLARSEELSLICREQLKLPTSDMARQTYIEHVQFVKTACETLQAHGAHNAAAAHMVQMSRQTWQALRTCCVECVTQPRFLDEYTKTLDSRLVKSLDALQWPTKKRSVPLDYHRDPVGIKFRWAFFECAELDKMCVSPDKHSATSLHSRNRQTLHTLPALSSTKPQEQTVAVALPIHALAQPLVLRFRYHFDTQRPTNRLDKVGSSSDRMLTASS